MVGRAATMPCSDNLDPLISHITPKPKLERWSVLRGEAGLFAGGGDLPQSHLDIANKFSNVTCVDISQIALDIAERRLPSAQKLLGSICALPEHYSDQFDCAFASHVIYHIEANQQSKAVRELIRACKPGGRIVILYSNPASPIRFAAGAVHRLRKIIVPEKAVQEAGLYFSPHPLRWWKQFENDCDISMKPWDVIGSYKSEL
jgi:SAM-dependent methyltransferase